MTFNSIKNWFLHSETILWARIQLFVGAIWTVLIATDLSPVIPPQYFTYWLVLSGVISELLRRRGTETITVPVFETPGAPAVPVTMLSSTPPGP